MKNGDIGYSAPCIDCSKFLKDKGFKKVYFTDYNGDFKDVNIQKFVTHHKSLARRITTKN